MESKTELIVEVYSGPERAKALIESERGEVVPFEENGRRGYRNTETGERVYSPASERLRKAASRGSMYS